jgi:predicted peptidase
MRGNWHWCLALVIFTFFGLISCRKHQSDLAQPIPPHIPTDSTRGTDTIPNVPSEPTYNEVARNIDINDNVGGYYEALPPSYDTSKRNFPLLLFLHGGGELGDGKSQLPLILKNSLTKRLHERTLPASFTVNDEEFSFIIISPQFKSWPSVEDVHDIFEFLSTRYRIDTKRIYLSGLSMGGGVTWEFAGSQWGRMVAAIVPICGASWADSAVAKNIATNDVPGWAFHNIDDRSVTVNSTKRYVGIINEHHPLHPIKMTLWPVGGHDAWTLASDPEYREEGKNMYEWMLQFTR